MPATEEIVEFRRVGEQERIFHYLHALGSLIPSSALRVRGPLTSDMLRDALAWIQKQHPVLRAHIRYEGYAYRSVPPFAYPIPILDTRGTSAIPLRIVESSESTSWQEEFRKESSTPIGRGKHPRMRIVLVHEGDDADLHYIIMTCDHAIADAQAASMIIDDLFRYLADPSAMRDRPPVHVSLPPSLEEGLSQKSKSTVGGYQPAIRFPKTDVPNPIKATLSVQRVLEPAVANALRNAIRTHRTTMHGAIGAAFLAAARDKFGIDEMTVLSTVELRRMMRPPLPVTAFGCYIDILRTHHSLSAEFWKMASDLSFKLVATLARDQNAASILKLATWEVYKHETIPTITHRKRIDGIAITTAGTSHANKTYGPLSIEENNGGVSIDMFGPSLFIVSTETDGDLDIKVGYAADALSTKDAEDLTNRAMAQLIEAAGL